MIQVFSKYEEKCVGCKKCTAMRNLHTEQWGLVSKATRGISAYLQETISRWVMLGFKGGCGESSIGPKSYFHRLANRSVSQGVVEVPRVVPRTVTRPLPGDQSRGSTEYVKLQFRAKPKTLKIKKRLSFFYNTCSNKIKL